MVVAGEAWWGKGRRRKKGKGKECILGTDLPRQVYVLPH